MWRGTLVKIAAPLVSVSACVITVGVASLISDIASNDDFLIVTRHSAGACLPLCGRDVNHRASFLLFSFRFVHFIPRCRCCCSRKKRCTQRERQGCNTRDGLWCGCARSKCQVDDDKWPTVADKLVIMRRPNKPELCRSSVLQARHSGLGPFLSLIYLYGCMCVYKSSCIHTNICLYAHIHTFKSWHNTCTNTCV